MKMKRMILVALLCSCSSTPGTENNNVTPDPGVGGGFPVSGNGGKTDVFGRSLVGAPNPYEIDGRSLADQNQLESELFTDMKARRDFGWDVMQKLLEPVPLLGLENQLERRPDCTEGVVRSRLRRLSSTNV